MARRTVRVCREAGRPPCHDRAAVPSASPAAASNPCSSSRPTRGPAAVPSASPGGGEPRAHTRWRSPRLVRGRGGSMRPHAGPSLPRRAPRRGRGGRHRSTIGVGKLSAERAESPTIVARRRCASGFAARGPMRAGHTEGSAVSGAAPSAPRRGAPKKRTWRVEGRRSAEPCPSRRNKTPNQRARGDEDRDQRSS